MSENIVWGDPIAVHGKRPEWLEDGQVVQYHNFLEPEGRWFPARYETWGPNDWRWATALRLPADHPHYRQPAPIDWSGELEAVHEDGRVVPAFAVDKRRVSDYRGVRIEGQVYQGVQQEYWFHEDGLRVHDRDWRIRNVTPQADTKPDVTARMEKLVRKMNETGSLHYAKRCDPLFDEARAIVALLTEPVDPDLIEAREIAAAYINASVVDVYSGGYDSSPEVACALMGLKRRALALAGEKEA